MYLHPRYRTERPLDAILAKVRPELDPRFPNEVYAEKIEAILSGWRTSLLNSVQDRQVIERNLASAFVGTSPVPVSSRSTRSSAGIQVYLSAFSADMLGQNAFLTAWKAALNNLSKITVAEFQVTRIDASEPTNKASTQLQTRIRYELVGSGEDYHREQRVGNWQVIWQLSQSGEIQIVNWRMLDETRARSMTPIYADVTSAALGTNPSYSSQLLHGTDYWRTVLDGACGIDVYGHNGVSVADIDNDGFDDLYVCQAAGLPNRLYRNRGDGAFEDITESSGLGLLENTVCALFADYDNDGKQDVILVRNNGPLLFLNQGGGKFKQKTDAFQFANPPQGTFTGAAVADYDRDGWLDVYFCLYAYYQGTGQYKYPSPYHDAENGPPNFLMRNNRDGTFRDATAESGLNKNNTRYSFCCGWGDFDGNNWPDLYVVNDFGRKNLYRNNGDGTFTDVASKSKAEDVGAGMSVCWLDYDRDGAEDLYVGNMWTAAGVRISMQSNFRADSAGETRTLYQKHAMGNSQLHNAGTFFDDVTNSSGTGIGRWSWSSDAVDFDHDGYPDLYVVNGMVSGPSGPDLNSFFWRQVVANSPDRAGSSGQYEQGWNAINELIRADGSWSGYERNVLYANNRDGTFSDVSAVTDLDFIEDGRSFAIADFDGDGRQEMFLKNRSAPQLRVLKNVLGELPPSVSFRLKGTTSNRDAIGASVTIATPAGRQTRMLQCGSAFLSQHSKDIFFGLGDATGTVDATIRWPNGLVQELRQLPINHRIWVDEGSAPSKMEAFRAPVPPSSRGHVTPSGESLPTQIETWLLAPVPAPDFSLPDLFGKSRSIAEFKDKLVLLTFWTAKSHDCQVNLNSLEKNYSKLLSLGLQTLCLDVSGLTLDPSNTQTAEQSGIAGVAQSSRLKLPILRGSEDTAAVYNIVYRQLFDRHRDLTLPTSFLIDGRGYIVKVYQGLIDPDHVTHDLSRIPQNDAQRVALALPFPSGKFSLEFGRNHLSTGALFFQRGYLEQAEVSFQMALRDDPSSAEALYGIGAVYLNQNKKSAAREMFERCVKLQPNYPDTWPDAWNNLGVLATRENHVEEAVTHFQKALSINPRHLLSLNNLGNAYRLQKRWDDARNTLERALEVAPDDPEANYSLGMVFAQINETGKAYEYLRRALSSRPVYPEALNNLGILYLITHRRDEAVASFEECIRVAPSFDQAYLNLARVYALEGDRDKARTVLLDLLKKQPDHPQATQLLGQLPQ